MSENKADALKKQVIAKAEELKKKVVDFSRKKAKESHCDSNNHHNFIF